MDASLTNQVMLDAIAAFEASDLEVLHLRNGEVDVYLSRRANDAGSAAAPAVGAPGGAERDTAPGGAERDTAPGGAERDTAPAPTGGGQPPVGAADSASTDLHVVRAPMVGIVYRCPDPGADPFVTSGTPVVSSDTVALIEAMKLFTGVTASVDGEVEEIFVENGELVEYGQELMTIRCK